MTMALVVACGGDDGDEGGGPSDAEADEASASASASTTHDHNAMQAAERGEEPVSVDPDDRCDLALNTAEFNDQAVLVETKHEHLADMQASPTPVSFTLEEWAEVFTDPNSPVSPAAMAEGIEANPAFRDMILSGLFTHTIEADSWVPVTDTTTCEALADELQRARDVVAEYPTAADALAAGYRLSSPYAPGQGSHYSNIGFIDGDFDPDEPEMLMFDGMEPGAALMGMSYFVIAPDGVPDDYGFSGTNDQWHSHNQLCQNAEGIAVAPAECAAGRANTVTGLNGWMLHAWLVPGCESPWGVFSGANPRLPIIPPGAPSLGSGCGSGRTVGDDLGLDGRGDGPRLR